MLRVFANHANNTLAFDDLALVADLFNTGPDFHCSCPVRGILWPYRSVKKEGRTFTFGQTNAWTQRRIIPIPPPKFTVDPQKGMKDPPILGPGNTMPTTYPLKVLSQAVEPYLPPDCYGWAVVGSVARNEPVTADTDYWLFVPDRPIAKPDHYRLVWDDQIGLLSLGLKSTAGIYKALTHPRDAVFAIPAIQTMVIGQDSDDRLESLRHYANAFAWQSVKPAADQEAAAMLIGLAEETMKVWKGIKVGHQETAITATLGIALTCPWIAVLAQGLHCNSENHFVALAAQSMGKEWTDAQATAAGSTDACPTWQTRGRAAIHLYHLTVQNFKHLLDAEAQNTAQKVLERCRV